MKWWGVALVAACGRAGAPSADPALGNLNRQIPAYMVSYLDFVRRDAASSLRGLRVRAMVPSRWDGDVPDDRYLLALRSPAHRPTRGHDTLAISVDCAGPCGPADRTDAVTAQALAEVPDDGLLGTRPLPHGVLRWGKTARGAAAYAGWAPPGSTALGRCVVSLVDPDLVEAIAVFAEACAQTQFAPLTPPPGT